MISKDKHKARAIKQNGCSTEKSRTCAVNALKMSIAALMAWFVLSGSLITPAHTSEHYTPQAYIKDRGLKQSSLIPPGKLKIDGTRMSCGKRPTVMDTTLDDYGGAFDTFIILNPRLLKRLPRQVKLWVYSHECAHQFRGGDEIVADCFGIKRGVRYGWLNKKGMDQICKFIWTAPASTMHPPGPKRCALMRSCFKKATTKK